MRKTVFTFGGPWEFGNHAIEVLQEQEGEMHFEVRYGLQVTKSLSYQQACTEIGQCILHLQCYEGIASNEGE